MASSPNLISLHELKQEISPDVYDHIRSMYEAHYRALRQQQGACCEEPNDDLLEEDHCGEEEEEARRHMDRFLRALSVPPGTTYVRVNFLSTTSNDDGEKEPPSLDDSCARRRQVEAVVNLLTESVEGWVRRELEQQQRRNASSDGQADKHQDDDIQVLVKRHGVLPDVVSIRIERKSSKDDSGGMIAPSKGGRKRVICDRLCGEAMMRGSDAFVRGILCADPGIVPGDEVDVYASLPTPTAATATTTTTSTTTTPTTTTLQTRGLKVDKCTGSAVFLGWGTAACSRPDFFRLESGVAVRMSLLGRVGPILPPLPTIPGGMLQNLPSIVVGHVLQPQPHQTILDMCAAPGGKTLHVASLVRNQATIVACDRSRSKMVAARAMFLELGATCIQPLAVDSTRLLVENAASEDTQKSVVEILSDAQKDKDGFLDICHFPKESFDRILLDAPCSALGLRPKLAVELSYKSLLSYASYQRKLAAVAVQLLKPGGILTYSTCTINHEENEQLVRHVLDLYGHAVELEPIDIPLGGPGLAGVGLTESERLCVRRFDPADDPTDSIGFFVAKFRKR